MQRKFSRFNTLYNACKHTITIEAKSTQIYQPYFRHWLEENNLPKDLTVIYALDEAQ